MDNAYGFVNLDRQEALGMASSTGTVPAGSTEQWQDRKRYLWLIGLVVPSLAFIGYRHVARSPAGACGSGSARS